MGVLTSNNEKHTELVKDFLKKSAELNKFFEGIDTKKFKADLSVGGKQRGGFNNDEKIRILGEYIALLKEFISIRRPYTFASYRIKNPGSAFKVKINEDDKVKLRSLYAKLSSGYLYVTLKSLLSTQYPDLALTSELNILFPSSGPVKIYSKAFLKEIEALCNNLDKLLFKVTKFLILPPPPLVAEPMNLQELGYSDSVVVPEVSNGYTVVPSQAQTQAIATANLAREGQPPLYAKIADPIYFDVSVAGDAAGSGIPPRTLDRHISLFGADDNVTLEGEDEHFTLSEAERVSEEQPTDLHAGFIQCLLKFNSEVVPKPDPAGEGVYTLLPPES